MSEWIPTKDKVAKIRSKIKKGCKGLSIRMDRGTAYGWIHISALKGYHLSEEQEAHLVKLGLTWGLDGDRPRTIFSPEDVDALYSRWFE